MRIQTRIKRLLASQIVANLDSESLHNILITPSKKGKLDSRRLFFETEGILQYQNPIVTGERHLIKKVLPEYFRTGNIIVCDVGANVGEYSQEILDFYPNARIFAFEPHPKSFATLLDRFRHMRPQIGIYNTGLSAKSGKLLLYDYSENNGSSHASLYRDVLQDFHKENTVASTAVRMTTLDEFLLENRIDKVDLLKIDTEGHELEVLKGAVQHLQNDAISIIQFEFNEMNISSRVFLKDFYNILGGFQLFRLASDRIIPLGNYNSRNEIFCFQNILAINKRLQ